MSSPRVPSVGVPGDAGASALRRWRPTRCRGVAASGPSRGGAVGLSPVARCPCFAAGGLALLPQAQRHGSPCCDSGGWGGAWSLGVAAVWAEPHESGHLGVGVAGPSGAPSLPRPPPAGRGRRSGAAAADIATRRWARPPPPDRDLAAAALRDAAPVSPAGGAAHSGATRRRSLRHHPRGGQECRGTGVAATGARPAGRTAGGRSRIDAKMVSDRFAAGRCGSAPSGCRVARWRAAEAFSIESDRCLRSARRHGRKYAASEFTIKFQAPKGLFRASFGHLEPDRGVYDQVPAERGGENGAKCRDRLLESICRLGDRRRPRPVK